MYKLYPFLLAIASLFSGTGLTSPNKDLSYASLKSYLGLPSAQITDTAEDETDYTVDIAQGTCSDDPDDLEPFDSTRVKFTINNDHYLPVRVVRVRLKIRNIVTNRLKVLKVVPYSYSEIAANDSGEIQVLMTTISGGLKYYIGSTEQLEAGSYNIKALIKVRNSNGETTTLKAGLSIGAFDINRC